MAKPVRRSVRNTVIAIIVLAAAFQVFIVPWNEDTPGMRAAYRQAYSDGAEDLMLRSLEYRVSYAPLWQPPVYDARVRVDRFALQVGAAALLLLLWVVGTRPVSE